MGVSVSVTTPLNREWKVSQPIAMSLFNRWKVSQTIATPLYRGWKVCRPLATTLCSRLKVSQPITTQIYNGWKVRQPLATRLHRRWKVGQPLMATMGMKVMKELVLKEIICSLPSPPPPTKRMQYRNHSRVPTVLEKSLNFGFSLKSPWKWICPWKVLEFRGPSLKFQLVVLDFLFCVFWLKIWMDTAN